MPAPDYTSILLERVELPFSKDPFLKLTFADPALAGYHVFVVEDSLPLGNSDSDHEERLVTMVARFPRPILAEVNTHRVFGRNSASSRARSVKATLKEAMENPYIPIWTINRKGMSGEYASQAVADQATKLHLLGRDKAVATTLSLLLGEEIFAEGRSDTEIAGSYEELLDRYYADVYDSSGEESEAGLSLHKQAVNRALEPYLFHEAIITSSYWDNFLALRDHEDADPGIRSIAVLMREALQHSSPIARKVHLPFVPEELRPVDGATFSELREVLLLSATECAQISYRDKSNADKSTATTALGERLLKMRHLSPFEHQGISASHYFDAVAPKFGGLPTSAAQVASNLSETWVQARPVLAGITR